MKIIFTVVILLAWMPISAQQALDTIFANQHKNVALFFPSPIRQAVTGASHFVFTYNREKAQYFGLLQAKPGTESNLLAVTNDGQVYSYILKFRKQISKLNYFVSLSNSIGNERPIDIRLGLEKKVKDSLPDRADFFNKYSAYLVRSENETMATKQKKGVKLQLKKMVYRDSVVYLVLEVKNLSGIDFEIDYLNVYRTNGSNKRKASYQRLKQDVIYKYDMQCSIKNGEKHRFVYILPKFVLGDNENLMIELKELKGNRVIGLRTDL